MTSEDDDIHLERIFSKKQAIEILEQYYNQFTTDNQPVIITNDSDLNRKYRNVYNTDEFKKFCGVTDFEEKNIKLNLKREIFKSEVYEYFEDIVDFKIISATEQWKSAGFYTDENHQTFDLGIDYYGWETNLEFEYFKLPEHIEEYNFYGSSSLSDFEKNIEIDFKKIIEDNSSIQIKDNKQFIWYWSNKKRIRVIAELDLIKSVLENSDVKIKIEKNIVLVKNENSPKFGDYLVSFYLVYVISKLNQNIEGLDNYDNHNQKFYDSDNWLKNTSGTDDPETMNDVYWNLD